jgi:hypothetical protein
MVTPSIGVHDEEVSACVEFKLDTDWEKRLVVLH